MNASKTQFLQLSTRHNLPDNYFLFFNDTQLSLISTLAQSFTKKLYLQLHISTLVKSASKKLSVLWRLRPFFSQSQLRTLYRRMLWYKVEMAGLAEDERQARKNFRVRHDVLNEYSDSELLKWRNIISLPAYLSSDSVSSSTPGPTTYYNRNSNS